MATTSAKALVGLAVGPFRGFSVEGSIPKPSTLNPECQGILEQNEFDELMKGRSVEEKSLDRIAVTLHLNVRCHLDCDAAPAFAHYGNAPDRHVDLLYCFSRMDVDTLTCCAQHGLGNFQRLWCCRPCTLTAFSAGRNIWKSGVMTTALLVLCKP